MLQTQMVTVRNRRATAVRNQDIAEISAVCCKSKKKQPEDTQKFPGNKNSGAINSISNDKTNKNINTNN